MGVLFVFILCVLTIGSVHNAVTTDTVVLSDILKELNTLKTEVKELNTLKTEVGENRKMIQQLTKQHENDKTKISELTEQLDYKSKQFENFRAQCESDVRQLWQHLGTDDIPDVKQAAETSNRETLLKHGNANTGTVDDNNTTSDAPYTRGGLRQPPTNRIVKRLLASDASTDNSQYHIAFTAFNSASATGLGNQQVIPFDSVESNVGNAFDPVTHIFICPVDGIYYFHSALMATRHTFIETEIVKEGATLIRMYAAGVTDSSAHGYDQGANSVVTSCNQGQHVWVQVIEEYGSTIYHGRFSSFSGFLLFKQ